MVPITSSSRPLARPVRQALFVVATGPGTVPDRVEWLRPRCSRPGSPRLLFPRARCRRLSLCQHLRTMRQLRRRPRVPTHARSSTRRHPRPPRRRPSTRVAIRDCTPRASHRQHRRSSPTAQKSRLSNKLSLTGTRGPVNGALVRRLDRTPAAARHAPLDQGTRKKASKLGGNLERRPTALHLAQDGRRDT